VDGADFEWLSQWKWHAVVRKGLGPVAARVEWPATTKVFMHRQIMDAHGLGEQIVHANGDTLDNRRANLRLATPSQIQQRRRKGRGRSPYKGVSWRSRRHKWEANIKLDGKAYYLGSFANEVEAAMVYDAAAREMFGDYAAPNFRTEEL
jgi:hypothetical protein